MIYLKLDQVEIEKKKKEVPVFIRVNGAACSSKDKQYLIDALKNMKPHINETDKKFKKTRDNLCQLIKIDYYF